MADYNSAYTGAEIDEAVGNGLAAPTTYAPISHANANTTYGAGTSSNYGHVKLSDSTSSTSSTSGGIAATPAAVKIVQDDVNTHEADSTSHITAAERSTWNAKQSALTFDDAPTSGSNNPVKSGGVYSALGTYVRPNLLDNAYFVGGGSQQGGGRFPINQRGQTSYTGEVYGIDRWIGRISTQVVSLQSGCLRMGVTSTYQADIHQFVESMSTLIGKTVTFSVLVRSDGTAQPSIGWQNTTNQGIKYGSTSTEWQLLTTTISPTASNSYPRVFFASTSGHYVEILAMKLELGSTQTLAHQENGVWVLNEIPNYQQELAKCQRYFYRFDYHGNNYGTMFGKTTSTTSARLTLPLPVRMRTNPAISSKGQIRIEYNGTYALSSDYTIYATSDEGVVFAIASLSSGSLPGDGYPVYAFFNTETDTDLSADL